MHHRIDALGRGAVLMTLVLALVALAACAAARQEVPGATPAPAGPHAAIAFPVTVTDDASRSVTVRTRPKRIVSLAPADTEILYSLGAFDRVVGVTTYDDYPAQVKSLPKMGDFQTPNLEAVAAARPDLVLVTGGVQADVISKLEAVGAKVLVVDPKDVSGVLRSIEVVARCTGTTDRGARVVSGMRADLASIAGRLSRTKPVRAFVEIGWSPLYTAGRGTLLNDLLVRAGGVNVVSRSGYVGYSVEQLVQDQPTVYLGTKSSIGDPHALETRPGYDALKAVQGALVYALDDDLVSRPGPRIVEGVREIAKALHPDLFK